jgi:dTMP kinase
MFVTFEGIDGSGKSTQAALLARRLEAEGREVVLTREPGGTALGERIRALLLDGGEVALWTEATLFAASRAQHVDELIRPALERGAAVVCDRFLDSSLAYQGIARGLGLEDVLALNERAVRGAHPDVTILLDLEAGDGEHRLGDERDRIEQEGVAFSARVRDAYMELAARFPERIVVLDASEPAERIGERVYERVRERFHPA